MREIDGSEGTRVVRDGQGRLWVNPTQAQLDHVVGATEELVLPQRLSPKRAARLAAQVFAGERDEASLGAWRAPYLEVLDRDRRQVRRFLAARAEHAEARAHDARQRGIRFGLRSSAAYSRDSRRNWVLSLSVEVDDLTAVQLYAAATRITTAMRGAVGQDSEWLYQFSTALSDRRRDVYAEAEMARFLVAADRRATTTDELRVLLQTVAHCGTAYSVQPFRREPDEDHDVDEALLLAEELAHSRLAPGSLAGPFEAVQLFRSGVLTDRRLAGLSAAQVTTLAGMLERGWQLDDALEVLAGLSGEELAAWGVVDHPDSNRRGRAAQAAAGDWATLRRWVAHRSGVDWQVADQVLEELSAMSPAQVQRAASSLSPAAMGTMAAWARSEGFDGGGTYVLRAAATFGKRSGEWQAKAARVGLSMHDATSWLPGPGAMEPADRDSFARYALEHLGRSGRSEAAKDLSVLVGEWSHLSEEERRLKPSALVRKLVAGGYGPAGDTALGRTAAGLRLAPQRVAEAAGVWAVSVGEVQWLPTGRRRSGEMTVEFLGRGAGEGLFLGELTDCCQSIGSVGESCAVHGQRAPDGGFMVVRDREGTIVAQAWCWLAGDGSGVCLDNVEILGDTDPGNRRAQQVARAVRVAGRWLVEDGHDQVNIGSGMSGISLQGLEQVTAMHWASYGGYSDARRQFRVNERSGGPQVAVRASGAGLEVKVNDRLAVQVERDGDLTRGCMHVTVAAAEEVRDEDTEELAMWLAGRGRPVRVRRGGGEYQPVADELAGALARAEVPDEPERLDGVLAEMAPMVTGADAAEAAHAVTERCYALARAVEGFSYNSGWQDDWDDDDDGWGHDMWDDPYDMWDDRYGAERHHEGMGDVWYRFEDRSDPSLRRAGRVVEWVSQRRLEVEHEVFGAEAADAEVMLEAELRDLDDDAPWDDVTLLGEYRKGGTFRDQLELGIEPLDDAVQASAGTLPEYMTVAEALLPGHGEEMAAAGVPLKMVYVLVQCGWTAEQIHEAWAVMGEAHPFERRSALRALGLARVSAASALPMLSSGLPLSAAAELAGGAADAPTVRLARTVGTAVDADAREELAAWV